MKTLWQKICASRNQPNSNPRALRMQVEAQKKEIINLRAQLANARANVETSKRNLIRQLEKIGVPNASAVAANDEQLEALRRDAKAFSERQIYAVAAEIAAAHGLRS